MNDGCWSFEGMVFSWKQILRSVLDERQGVFGNRITSFGISVSFSFSFVDVNHLIE